MKNSLKVMLLSFCVGVAIGHFAFCPGKIKEEKTNVQKNTTIIEKPDGTKTTIIKDKIVKELIEKPVNKDWLVTGNMNLGMDRQYGLAIHKRVIGSLYAGGFGNTNGTFGLSVGFAF